MPDSQLITLADEVVSHLNGETFSQSFTAVRRILPFFELKDMGTLHVSVVPATVEQSLTSRTGINELLTIQIGVQKRVDPQDNATVDPLLYFVEQIGDSLRQTEYLLIGSAKAFWRENRVDPVALRDHLESMRQFTSVLSTDWMVMRT